MRCGSCNKFVSFDEPQTEVQSVEINGRDASAVVRVVWPCLECGAELAEYTFYLEGQIEGKDTVEWEVTDEGEAVLVERLQKETPKGKPITNPRYWKKFYTIQLIVSVQCGKLHEGVVMDDEVAASELETI